MHRADVNQPSERIKTLGSRTRRTREIKAGTGSGQPEIPDVLVGIVRRSVTGYLNDSESDTIRTKALNKNGSISKRVQGITIQTGTCWRCQIEEVLDQIVGGHAFAFITIKQNHGGSDSMRS